ncbi:MAG: CRISPR-associated primase-polymerase type A1 [Bradymonadia bacterium]
MTESTFARMSEALVTGDWTGLRALLESVDPASLVQPEACQLSAQSAEALGDYERAVRFYHRALALTPDDVEVIRRLARIRTDQGQLDRATHAWRKVLELAPGDDEATEALATSLERAGRDEQAELVRPSRPRPTEGSSSFPPPDDSTLLTLAARFSGREGVHARQWVKPSTGQHGYEPVRAPLTGSVLREHLLGAITVGVYPLRMDNSVGFLAFDLDVSPAARPRMHTPQGHAALEAVVHGAAVRVVEALAVDDVVGLIEDSGWKGRHVWVFFDGPVPAAAARRLADRVAARVGDLPAEVTVEVFPKQGRIAQDKLGNLIKLPLGYHKVTGRRCPLLNADGSAVEAPFELLREVPLVSRAKLRALVEAGPPVHERAFSPVDTIDEVAPDSSGEGVEAPWDEETAPRRGGRSAAAQPGRFSAEIVAEPPYRLEDDAEAQWLLTRCEVLADVVSRAETTAVLSSDQRQVLTFTMGHLTRGAEAVNAVLGRLLNVEPEAFLKRPMRGHPMSCPRIRARIPEVAQAHRCDCRFAEGAGSYPTPLLHIREMPGGRPGQVAATDLSRLQVERLVAELLRARAEAARLGRVAGELEKRLREVMVEQQLDELGTPAGTLRLVVDSSGNGPGRLALTFEPPGKAGDA